MSDTDDFAGLDLRKFGSLSPLEQLDKLTTDGDRLKSYERRMREAAAELDADTKKDATP